MRKHALVLAAWLAAATPALAQDQPADEAIIRELIEITESAKLLDGVYAQVDSMMTQGMLDFYRSDAGRAVIAKMPVVMQHTMAAMPST